MSQIPKAVLKRLKPILEPKPQRNPLIRSLQQARPARRIATASTSSSGFKQLNLQALRSLAKHLFTRTVSSARQSVFAANPTVSFKESVGRLGAAAAKGARGSFQPSAVSFRAARVGLGGMGSAPMGPSVRLAGMRSVGNVGLGSARAYSSAARPLFDNLANAPVVLRALANSLEDKLENVRTVRPSPSTYAKGKASTSSEQSSNLFQSSSIHSLPSAVEATDAELYAHYFSPSPAHTLPAPSRSSSSTVTTLLIPFSLPSPASPSVETLPLSYLARSHRAAYEQHASRVDGLIDGLTKRGAFLDDLVRLEEVREGTESDGDILGLRVVFAKRSEKEVEWILREIEQETGLGDWFFLVSKRLGLAGPSTTASFIFPELSFSSSSTFAPPFPSASTVNLIDTGTSTPSSAISPSSSTSSLSSLSESEITSLDGSESVWLGFSSSFLSEREDGLVGSVMSF